MQPHDRTSNKDPNKNNSQIYEKNGTKTGWMLVGSAFTMLRFVNVCNMKDSYSKTRKQRGYQTIMKSI